MSYIRNQNVQRTIRSGLWVYLYGGMEVLQNVFAL